jgi:hypothetical protein
MPGNASITIPDLHVIVHLDTWVIIVRQKITVSTILVMDMEIVQ